MSFLDTFSTSSILCKSLMLDISYVSILSMGTVLKYCSSLIEERKNKIGLQTIVQ